ncbi:Glycosyl transferases group 1 [Roseomonas rosea]|jgi:glycosyltransferase involved in cell wall biosynthesis|uniref:Glycosyl transferases group 1 n=2 Tax=Muricoccus roseus TaxID=198092 RepID=A0A1M6ADB6_9PROT|nr:Glycosyl transferases group 1 [Roseomonas rosea]
MRIANIMAGAPMGGAETFFERISIALQGAGDEVLPVIRRDAARAARLRAGGLQPVELGFGGLLDVLTAPRLDKVLRDFRPDLAMAWMNRAARFAHPGSWVLVGRLGGYYDLSYYRRCDHLVANTKDLVRWIVGQGWDAARVHHLPNFAPDFSGLEPAELPAPGGAVKLLAMGRLHPNKGFDTLIRALAAVPQAHLSIAGEGPERAALEGLAHSLRVQDRVAFLGWRQDTGALLAGCDLFILSSRHEPLGNVVLEAFSAGVPVIATATPGPQELIADGESGLIVPIDDPASLAHAIGDLIADPDRAAALAEAGRAAFEAHHAEGPVLARWRALLPTLRPQKTGR